MQVRELSASDLMAMFMGVKEREQRKWARPMAIMQWIYNFGGPRPEKFTPKPMNYLYEKIFGGERGDKTDVKKIREQIDRAKAAIKSRENGDHSGT